MEMLKQFVLTFWERKILLLALVLVIIVLLLGATIFFRPATQISPSTQTPTAISSTPAVTVAVEQIAGAPSVKGITPIANSKNIGVKASIRVTFAQSVSAATRGDLQVTLTPPVTLSPLWQSNNTLLIETPTTPLRTNTRYSVSLKYKNSVIRQWYFSTIPDSMLTSSDQAALQAIGDKANADYWRNVSSSYPWYNKFPLQTKEYFVYFDIQKKSFIATLYPKPNTGEQIIKLKNTVTDAIKALGVPLTNLPIQWKVK